MICQQCKNQARCLVYQLASQDKQLLRKLEGLKYCQAKLELCAVSR